jgi:NTP pyrophosphatase (non-canonical NTP hydrolase)
MDSDLRYARQVDAVGDIVIYLASYCTANHIDLDKAVSNTWAEVKKRDWVQFPGNGVDR